MSQTSINQSGQPIAVAGLRSDNGPGDQVSRLQSEASTRIGFGLGVKPGVKEHAVLLPTASSSVIEGISMFEYNHGPGTFGDVDQSSSPPGLKPNASFSILRKGRIWVQIESGLTIAPYVDRAYCRAVANGGNTLIGAWTKTADGGNTVDCTKQAVFVSSARVAADGTAIAEMEVDFTNAP